MGEGMGTFCGKNPIRDFINIKTYVLRSITNTSHNKYTKQTNKKTWRFPLQTSHISNIYLCLCIYIYIYIYQGECVCKVATVWFEWPLPWLSPKIPRKRGTISGSVSQWTCGAVPNSQSFDPLTCAKLTCTKLPSNWQHLHPFPLLPRHLSFPCFK